MGLQNMGKSCSPSVRGVWRSSIALLVGAALITLMAMRLHLTWVLAGLERDDRAIAALREAINDRLTAMLNQEVGVRGFIGSGDPSFLDPYWMGRQQLHPVPWPDLELRPDTAIRLRAALAAEERASHRWTANIAEPELLARQLGPMHDLKWTLRAGKTTFDQYRRSHRVLVDVCNRVQQDANQHRQNRLLHAQLTAGGLMLLLSALGLWVSRSVVRRSVAPLVALARAAQRGAVESPVVAKDGLQEITVIADTLQKLLHAAEERAHRDGLTRAFNRGFLAEALPRLVRVAGRARQPLSGLMIDVDHFKRVNDKWGHGAGDKVLIAVARCLEREVRGRDPVVRYGGEEFALLLPETDLLAAARVGERIRIAIAALGPDDGMPDDVRVTVSVGVACTSGRAAHTSPLVAADAALYEAKRSGRNRVVVGSPEPIFDPRASSQQR